MNAAGKAKKTRRHESLVGSEIALESLKQFRNAIGKGNFDEMTDSLSEMLQKVGPEYFWAQLILFDENGTISFALTNPALPESAPGRSLRELRTRLVGVTLPSDSILRTLCTEYPGQSIYFEEVAANKRQAVDSKQDISASSNTMTFILLIFWLKKGRRSLALCFESASPCQHLLMWANITP